MPPNDKLNEPTNPYHYVLRCIGGKWKMTILHEIHALGNIRFNRTLYNLPISEKVLSIQLKEMANDGLVRRISYDTFPLKSEWVITPAGEALIPALDILYIWSIRRMYELNIPIDINNFAVHKDKKYVNELADIIESYDIAPDFTRKPVRNRT